MLTNLLAFLTISVVTNWTEIGTFNSKDGQSFKVEQGQIITNYLANVVYEDSIYEGYILKSCPGPVVDEKKTLVVITPYWQRFPGSTNGFPKQWYFQNGITPLYMTNDATLL